MLREGCCIMTMIPDSVLSLSLSCLRSHISLSTNLHLVSSFCLPHLVFLASPNTHARTHLRSATIRSRDVRPCTDTHWPIHTSTRLHLIARDTRAERHPLRQPTRGDGQEESDQGRLSLIRQQETDFSPSSSSQSPSDL